MSVQQQNLSSTQEIYKKISKLVTQAEWKIHAPLIEKINKIARRHQTRPVCTLDGFLDYVKEAEKNDIKDYPLYHWTKSVVQDPDKQIKHSKSFAFYFGDEQIYEKERAVSLYDDLVEFNDENKIEEIKMIDSNPRNNPQPPKNKN